MRKPPSTRAALNSTIGFGLVSIPVSLYTATSSDHGIKRKRFVEVEVDGKIEDHPVGNAALDKVTNEPTSAPIVLKMDTEHGYVFVEDHEIEQLFDIKPNAIEVKAFQPQSLFYQGAYVPNGTIHHVEPAKGNKGSAKTLGLLLKAMREEGSMALVEVTSRGIPKPAVLLPDGTMWGVYFEEQLRERREFPDVTLSPAEITQGRGLIQAYWSDDIVELTDTRTELIQAFAEEKAAAGDFTRPEEPTATVEETTTSDNDLVTLLAASVEQAKAEREKKASGS